MDYEVLANRPDELKQEVAPSNQGSNGIRRTDAADESLSVQQQAMTESSRASSSNSSRRGDHRAESLRLAFSDKGRSSADGVSSSSSSASSHQPDTPMNDDNQLSNLPILERFPLSPDHTSKVSALDSAAATSSPLLLSPTSAPTSPIGPGLLASASSTSSTYLPYCNSLTAGPSSSSLSGPLPHQSTDTLQPPYSPASTSSVYSNHGTPNTTLDTTSPPSDESESEGEEWDIFADYARASMYQPFDSQSLAQLAAKDGQSSSSLHPSDSPRSQPQRVSPSPMLDTTAKASSPNNSTSVKNRRLSPLLLPSQLQLPVSPPPPGKKELGSPLGPGRRMSTPKAESPSRESSMRLIGSAGRNHRASVASSEGRRMSKRSSASIPSVDSDVSQSPSVPPPPLSSSLSPQHFQLAPPQSSSPSPSMLAPSAQIYSSTSDDGNALAPARRRTASANTLRPIDTITTSLPSPPTPPSPLSPPSFSSSEAVARSPTFSQQPNSTFHAMTEVDLSSANNPVPISFFLGQDQAHAYGSGSSTSPNQVTPQLQQQQQQQQYPQSPKQPSPKSPASPTFSSSPARRGSSASNRAGGSPMIGLGMPSSPLATSFVSASDIRGERARHGSTELKEGRRAVTNPTPSTGDSTASVRSRESTRSGDPVEQPRPSLFPPKVDRPRSRSFSGQTLELGYPLYLSSDPQKQQAFLSLTSQPSSNNVTPHQPFSSNSPPRVRGFRDHRSTLATALTIQSDLRPLPSSPLLSPGTTSGFSSPRSSSDNQHLQHSTVHGRGPRHPSLTGPGSSPLLAGGGLRSPSNLSHFSVPSPVPTSPLGRVSHSSPVPAILPTRSVSISATSPKPRTSSQATTPAAGAIEPSTPKRSIFDIFRSRSASVSASARNSTPILPISSQPLPPMPSSTFKVEPQPVHSPASFNASSSGSIPSPSYSSDHPLPSTPKSNTPAVPFPSPYGTKADFHSTAPNESSVVSLTSQSSHSSHGHGLQPSVVPLDLEPPPRLPNSLKNALSSSSLKTNFSVSSGNQHLASPLRSPKSIVRLKKQSSTSTFSMSNNNSQPSGSLSPPKRTLGLAAPISSRDFQEESVKEGGLEVSFVVDLYSDPVLVRLLWIVATMACSSICCVLFCLSPLPLETSLNSSNRSLARFHSKTSVQFLAIIPRRPIDPFPSLPSHPARIDSLRRHRRTPTHAQTKLHLVPLRRRQRRRRR